jgi:SAM-dependent methyltransferase
MSITQTQVAEITATNVAIWNRCAQTYADGFEALTGQATTVLLDLAGVGRGTELLDVGTGPGTLLGGALARGARITAIDVAPAMIVAAQTRHPGADIRVADAHRLPFPDASFDAVTMGFCLHHTADPTTVLREARRVLRPGGRLALTVWDDMTNLEAFGLGFAAFADELPDHPPPQPLGEQPGDYERLLEHSRFAGPTARVLSLEWPVTDGAPLFDGFVRFLGLETLPPERAAIIRSRLDDAVRQRVDTTGTARLPNPAIIASARRPSKAIDRPRA